MLHTSALRHLRRSVFSVQEGSQRSHISSYLSSQKPSSKWSCRCYTSNNQPLVSSDSAPHGLEELRLPTRLRISALESQVLVESTLEPLVSRAYSQSHVQAPGSELAAAPQVFGFDTEWNISRKVGVSIIQLAPAASPNDVFIIPVRALLLFAQRRLPKLRWF